MTQGLRRWLVVTAAVVAILSAGVGFQPATAQESLDTDSVLIEVHLQPDGDAVWRVEYRYVLDSDNDTQAFQATRARIASNRSRYTSRFAERIRPAVASAANDTGRPMAMADVSVSTDTQTIPQGGAERGMVTYAFTWENFSATNATQIRAGDAIHGFYVSPKTKLIVTWPTDYETARQPLPSPDETGTQRAVWEGETDFASDEPAIVLAAEADVGPDGTDETVDTDDTDDTSTTATPAANDNNASAGGGDRTESGLPVVVLALAGVVALGAAGAGGAVALRRRDEASGSDAGGDAGESVPPELMSNEERVRTVLEEHGGRMKQQELAEYCDWHPSKTSKVVNDLKEEGAIDVFRLGRENIVTLPEVDLDDL